MRGSYCRDLQPTDILQSCIENQYYMQRPDIKFAQWSYGITG